MKQRLFDCVDAQRKTLLEISDQICDNPELGQQEHLVCGWLAGYLRDRGFEVETNVGGFPTAFRAEYGISPEEKSAPVIGLLCEYDALEGIGHGCGHHMQGPAIVGAAVALKNCLDASTPCRIVVYGTPAEETLGAKVNMLQNGCFRELDIALMTHASGNGTSVDNKTLAMSQFDVVFHGLSSHAAVAPERGRSAMDAMLLSFQGIEFLREHIPDHIRIHYCIPEAIRPVNAVPARAVGSYALRGFRRSELDEVIGRFEKIIEGAALMTDTTYEFLPGSRFDNAIGIDTLRDVLIQNAELVQAPKICGPREKTGSTDFGTVLHRIPGACIRIDCGCPEARGHSKELAALGKSENFHRAVLYAAKILAATAWDYISDRELRSAIKREFESAKDKG